MLFLRKILACVCLAALLQLGSAQLTNHPYYVFTKGYLSSAIASTVPVALRLLRDITEDTIFPSVDERYQHLTSGGSISTFWEPKSGVQFTHEQASAAIQALEMFVRQTVGTIGAAGLCDVLDEDGCLLATVGYEYKPRVDLKRSNSIGGRNVTKLADCGNMCAGFIAGLGHPYNQEEFAVPPKSIQAPKNARGICKRNDGGDMRSCMGADTLLAGTSLVQGQKLYSDLGATMTVTNTGDLRLYDKDGKQYWSWGIKKSTSDGPYKLHLETSGNLCMYNGKGVNYICSNFPGTGNHGNYRYTLQNDGNAVVYDVAGKVVTSTGTNVFPYTGPVPCDGPLP
ncbi:hypothetical protein BG015_000960 [Linnemannia schmuckeri]|uniref:Bulb-type lectin domain-containing protein n=1 Tax=Linnemannia schmuckeri TaxID=64567 RepID=A0A9P5V7D5_9FUNG|nr:hypothetical protein BG015_000960 [Linnemannia schmuckeri]